MENKDNLLTFEDYEHCLSLESKRSVLNKMVSNQKAKDILTEWLFVLGLPDRMDWGGPAKFLGGINCVFGLLVELTLQNNRQFF